MDTVQFVPHHKKQYKVEVTEFPEFNYTVSDIRKEGIKLEFVSKSKYELLFHASTNSKRYLGEVYSFVIMHRGRVILNQRFMQDEFQLPIKVNRRILPGGICRFVILDDLLRPISERLHYIQKDELNHIDIQSDAGNYQTRSKVNLELIDKQENHSESFSSLSIAIVDEKTIGKNGADFNIQSWLLIDSEIKGNIESPSDFFIDDTTYSSESKLDLLMLTHGWSRYLWNSFPESGISNNFKETEGFSISGKVIRNYSKQAIANGKVNLTLFNDEYAFTRDVRTDSDGRFSFDKMCFTDTASLFLQAWNEKEQSYRRVSINPLFKNSPRISATYLPKADLTIEIPTELRRQKYYSDVSFREYKMKTGSFFIEEVEIVAEKGDGIYRKMYNKPVSSLKVTMADYSYSDLFSYLRGRVPGLTVRNDGGISIRGPSTLYGSNEVLYLLNGMPVSKEVIQSVSLAEIDVVDVLKSVAETVIFGMRGANGVIAVYTKMGASDEETNADPLGIISERIYGYVAYKDFYNPTYTAENIYSEMPDHRMTLYWNPNIITENGKASISFFTSDDIGRYKIFVEGITGDGDICLGTGEIEVK